MAAAADRWRRQMDRQWRRIKGGVGGSAMAAMAEMAVAEVAAAIGSGGGGGGGRGDVKELFGVSQKI